MCLCLTRLTSHAACAPLDLRLEQQVLRSTHASHCTFLTPPHTTCASQFPNPVPPLLHVCVAASGGVWAGSSPSCPVLPRCCSGGRRLAVAHKGPLQQARPGVGQRRLRQVQASPLLTRPGRRACQLWRQRRRQQGSRRVLQAAARGLLGPALCVAHKRCCCLWWPCLAGGCTAHGPSVRLLHTCI